ncbi:MAG: hypothetical protein ACJA0V_002588, partial [Planctomycetota bacterium]
VSDPCLHWLGAAAHGLSLRDHWHGRSAIDS